MSVEGRGRVMGMGRAEEVGVDPDRDNSHYKMGGKVMQGICRRRTNRHFSLAMAGEI